MKTRRKWFYFFKKILGEKSKENQSCHFRYQNTNVLCVIITSTARASSVFLVSCRSTTSSSCFITGGCLNITYQLFDLPFQSRECLSPAFLTWPFTEWVFGLPLASCNLFWPTTHLARKSSNILLVLSICLTLRHMTSLCHENLIKKYCSKAFEFRSMPYLYCLRKTDLYTAMKCIENKQWGREEINVN